MKPRIALAVVLAGAFGGIGCAASVRGVTPSMDAPAAWNAVACASCGAAHIRVEARAAAGSARASDPYSIARVQNLNVFPVVVEIEFTTGDPPDADGWVPRERLQFTLASAGSGNDDGDSLLSLPRVQTAAVVRMERVR
jgi:hypothetical protein